MEMHQIRYFLAVCSERNFTRAAKLCNVTQPSLTRAIKLLEAEFGGFLFRREHAKSPLTELGEIVRPHLQDVWERSQAAVIQAHEFAAISMSRLKIGIMSRIAPQLLVELLSTVRAQHDSIEIEVVGGSASDLRDQLLGGRIGAAIYADPEDKADPRLLPFPLFREQMLIAMPASHRLADRTDLRLTDLAGESYVHRPRCEFNELMARLLRQHRVKCATLLSIERDDLALALIARGAGLGLFPRHTVDAPGIVLRPLADFELWREINLVTLRERRRNKGLSALLDEAARIRWPS